MVLTVTGFFLVAVSWWWSLLGGGVFLVVESSWWWSSLGGGVLLEKAVLVSLRLFLGIFRFRYPHG